MKKIVLILLMMIIGLVGCGKSIDTEKAGKEEELSIEEQNVQSAKQTIEKVFENTGIRCNVTEDILMEMWSEKQLVVSVLK